jgi:glycosyltransferase involved in cell wall biosynthesis
MDDGRRTKTVLAVGRLHEQKGFDLLLNAWQPIEAHYPDWTLRIVGEGPKRTELEAQIKELGLRHVVLAGRTEDMKREYASASLFVLSSRYEGLPLALIEAMWCGLPCVAFDCPQGPAELLAEERGWLVFNGDIRALSAQIEQAISQPEEAAARAQKAQAYAQENYSESAIMPKWVEMIERGKE